MIWSYFGFHYVFSIASGFRPATNSDLWAKPLQLFEFSLVIFCFLSICKMVRRVKSKTVHKLLKVFDWLKFRLIKI
jgi:hypothetical protein